MSVQWSKQETNLVIRLGELTLYSHQFPTLVFNAAQLSTPGDPLELDLPFGDYTEGVEALIVRSFPIENELVPMVILPEAIRYVTAQYRRQYIDMTGDFANYLKKFSAKRRAQLKRLVKEFKEFSDGNILWKEYRHANEIDAFYLNARMISITTYQEKLLNVGFPDTYEYKVYLQQLAKEDGVRGYVLFHRDKPIAYVCCLAIGSTLLYEHVGYDSNYRHLSPGNVLQYLILEKIFADNYFKLFDFNEGDGAHKAFFATHSVLRANYFFFRKTIRNYLLVKSHYSIEHLSSKLASMLDRYGLKAKLKRYIRSRV